MNEIVKLKFNGLLRHTIAKKELDRGKNVRDELLAKLGEFDTDPRVADFDPRIVSASGKITELLRHEAVHLSRLFLSS